MIKIKRKAKAKPLTPQEEGYEAYYRGETICPYDALCGASKVWNEGWWQAQAERELKQ